MESGDLVFSDEDLVNFLSMFFDNVITVDDFRQLKPEFVQTVYCNFLRDFGVSLDQPNLLPLDVNDSVRQHPQVYQSVGRSMVLARVIRDFLKRLKCDLEFMPADFFNPNPKRTRRFFSSLIEFYYFAHDHIDELCGIEAESKIKREGKEKQIERVAEKREKIRQLKRENEETKIREEQMLKRIAEVKGEIQELQAKKVSHKSQLEQLKVDIASLTTDVKAKELEILEKKELVEKLASQVVQDSEFKEIENLENLVAKYKSENAEKASNVANLKETLQITKSAAELLKNELMPILQEVQEATNCTKEINTEMSQLDTAIKMTNEETGDHDMKIQHLDEILLTRQEKLSQMHTAWKMKKDSLQEEIKQLKLTHEKILQNQTEDEIAGQDLMKERSRIIRETQQCTEQFNQFDIMVATNYLKILQVMDVHTNDTHAALETFTESVSRKDEGN